MQYVMSKLGLGLNQISCRFFFLKGRNENPTSINHLLLKKYGHVAHMFVERAFEAYFCLNYDWGILK